MITFREKVTRQILGILVVLVLILGLPTGGSVALGAKTALSPLPTDTCSHGWAKSMGGTPADAGYSIATDASGKVYTTGLFSDTVAFEPGTGTDDFRSEGDSDIFVQKLSNNLGSLGPP